LAGLVTLTEMKAKQEDIVKERERQIVTSKTTEAHLNIAEAGTKSKHFLTKQVTDFIILMTGILIKFFSCDLTIHTVCYFPK